MVLYNDSRRCYIGDITPQPIPGRGVFFDIPLDKIRQKGTDMGHLRLPKKLLAAVLAGALTASQAAAVFSDTSGHWAEDTITKWSEEYGIITGYEDGTFRPDASITRGAFAGILDRFMQFQSKSPADTFSDTPGTYWENAVLKLHASGVYLGNNGKALTGDTITRQQAVTMVARAFGITGDETYLPYDDEAQIAGYARGPIAEMTARGYITDARDHCFRPTDPITRGEIVNLLGNIVAVLIQEPCTYFQDVEGSLMINAADGAFLQDMTISGDLILAPGVVNAVSVRNVTIEGSIRNLSGVEIAVILPDPEPEPDPDPEPEPEPNPDPVPEPDPDLDLPWVEASGSIVYDNYNVPIYEDLERNWLTEEEFAWEGDRITYVGDVYDTRFGIDVSAYQNQSCPDKTIDWEAVAEDGVDFAMVRIGFRGYGTGSLNSDAFYERNIDGAMEAGIDTGVYFFSQAITVEEAIEEAEYVISLLDGHEISGPVAYDWEMHNSSYRVYGISPKMATACALAFCQRIEEEGYQPMIYASKYVGYNKFNLPQLAEYPIWFPEYGKDYPKFYYEIDTWQYTSSCTVAGITGKVDANIQFIR